MSYVVVSVEYDPDNENQVKISLRRDKVEGDTDKNDYNRIHTNYVPIEHSEHYYVGKTLVLA